MKFAILGAGAMGGLFGSYLSKRNEVTMIDVAEVVVDAINTNGLTVIEQGGSSAVYHPRAVTSVEGMEPVDMLIVFTSSLYSESALNSSRPVIGPDTYIMTLQNGSGHEDLIGRFTDQEHIVIGTTQHGATGAGAGISRHTGSGESHFGCVTGDVSRLQPFADEFTACGLAADVSDDVQKMIWNKMFTNVSASALTAVLQVPLGYIASDAHAWSLCQTLIREAVDAAAGLGMDFDYDEKVAEVRRVCENAPGGLTSIYTCIRTGRKTEVDTISGSIVRAGRKCGVPTPSHEAIVNLIHAMEERPREQ